jgi:hypothetical protein
MCEQRPVRLRASAIPQPRVGIPSPREITESQRERDVEYLRAARYLLRGFDHAVGRASGEAG